VKPRAYNLATHLSVVWGVTLAVITLLEWNSLDRDPVGQAIISPFIERTMEVTVTEAAAKTQNPASPDFPPAPADAVLNYEVEFHFNGPLFLACFFGPILLFHSVGMLWRRLRGA